jgi:hypothetical protein
VAGNPEGDAASVWRASTTGYRNGGNGFTSVRVWHQTGSHPYSGFKGLSSRKTFHAE